MALTDNEKNDIITFIEAYISIPAEKRAVVDGFVQGMAYTAQTNGRKE